MLLHHTDLETLLLKKSKRELVKIISDTYQLTHGKAAWELFGELNYEFHLGNLKANILKQHVRSFYLHSLDGKYYEPLMAGKKHYMDIPEQTAVWCDEISLLLDLSCELVLKGERATAKYCFDELLDLVNRLGDDTIVYAHETGEWMITCKHNYRAIYQELQA